MKLSPGLRLPESNSPISDVTVCVVESAFPHVTFAPCLTVSVDGVKARLFIVTVFWTAGLPAVDVALGLGLDVDVQPAIIAAATTTAANTNRVRFFTFSPPRIARLRLHA